MVQKQMMVTLLTSGGGKVDRKKFKDLKDI